MPDAMNTPRTGSLRRWGLIAVAVCAAWAGGRLTAPDLAARAQTAASLNPLDRLLAEDDIRQKVVLYSLYADGDGVGGHPRDLRKMADTLMTPDVVSESYPADGSAPLIMNGREPVAQSHGELDPERRRRIAGRHYLIDTVFDSLTPTTAETRTPAVYFDATRNVVGANCHAGGESVCSGVPVRTILWVYHMSWRKTPQGWQIARNVLRDDN